jgi:hypothetical protein
MHSESDESRYVHKVRPRVSTILLLLIIDALVYFVPIRNKVFIGDLFGISLWIYFGILNAILILLVYIFVKGEVSIDFLSQKIIFHEFTKDKSWDFDKLWGVYFLAFDGDYLIRIRTHRLQILDIRVPFDMGYELVDKFEESGIHLKTIRQDEDKKISKTFPLLLSQYEKKKPKGFNPEFPNWSRNVTLKTKLISITMAPLLYILGATLIVKIPHLLIGITASKGVVAFVYAFTAFLLFDGGLYLLFGISVIVLLARQIIKISSSSRTTENPDLPINE